MSTPVGPPYAPSIVDGITAWMSRRFRHPALVYLPAAAALAAIATGIEWLVGQYPVGVIKPYHVLTAGLAPVWLWLIGVFNSAGDHAVTRLRPVLAVDEVGLVAVRLRLTALPFRPTLILCLVAAVAGVARTVRDPGTLSRLGLSREPLSFAFVVVLLVLLAFVGITFVLKLLWSAWQVHRLSTSFVRVDLARVNLLTGLAGLTGLMAASLALSITGFVAVAPESVRELEGLLSAGSAIVISGIVFVVPLVGVHDQLVSAKTAALDAAQSRFLAIGERLHGVIDANDLPSMDPLNKAIAAAEVELRGLRAIPTWPWLPDTFRWVVGALMFPIVLFLAQALLSRLII